MNNKEGKVIHGLYFHHELIGNKVFYPLGAIAWVANAKFREGGRDWVRPKGGFNQQEISGSEQSKFFATNKEVVRILNHLKAREFIEYDVAANHEYKISVTANGAERARELHSWYGRLNLRFKEHKDGLIWLLVNILVSMITAWVTAWVATRFISPRESRPGAVQSNQPTQQRPRT